MKPEVDMYLKWTADRMFKSWDTYGKIVQVDHDTDGNPTSVHILTFDDFAVTKIHYEGESWRDEIKIKNKTEVVRYYRNLIIEEKAKIEKKKLYVDELEEMIKEHM